MRKIAELIREIGCKSIHTVSELTTIIVKETVGQILHELFNMRNIWAKMMPILLEPEQKKLRTLTF